jgi:TetR/AcrR family acrAB operon transcriptional repressor
MASEGSGTERSSTDRAAARRPRTPQVERRALSEGRIIAAALRIIAEKGVQGMTLADAGARAGYSRGLPAHLFGSRAELLRQCALSLSEQVWQDNMPLVASDGAIDGLARAIRAWIDLLNARPAFARAYYLMAAESFRDTDAPEPFAQVVRDFSTRGQARFAALIADGIRTGEIAADVDADVESRLIHATLRGLGMQWLLRAELVDLTALTEALIANLRRQLAAPR